MALVQTSADDDQVNCAAAHLQQRTARTRLPGSFMGWPITDPGGIDAQVPAQARAASGCGRTASR